MEKEKLAYVAHYYPYVGGYGTRILGQLRALSEKFDISFFYYMKKGDGQDLDIGKYVKKEIMLLKNAAAPVSTADIVGGKALKTIGFGRMAAILKNCLIGRMPLYVALYYSEEAKRKFESHLAYGGISRVWAYSTIGGAIARDAKGGRKVLDFCDAGARLFTSFYQAERNPLLKALYWFEAKEALWFEKKIAKKFNATAVISAKDRECMGFGADNCVVLPIYRETAKQVKAKRKNTDIVMCGRWDYQPNRVALQFALDRILPALWDRYTVRVIGPGASESQIAQMKKGVYLGMVDDYFGFLAGCRICIVPTPCGAGQQTKVIDAVEMGLIVLASSFAKESSDQDDRCKAIVECKSVEKYVANAKRLLQDRGECAKLAKAAVAFSMKSRGDSALARKRTLELADMGGS